MIDASLFDLDIGQSATVQGIHADGPIRRRLLDLGLTDGAKATCLYAAPSGDPKAYWVRGTVIALRKEDAQKITSHSRAIPSKKEVPLWA